MAVTMEELKASENPMGELTTTIMFSFDGVSHELADVTHDGANYLDSMIRKGRKADVVLQEKYFRDRRAYEMSNLSFTRLEDSIGVYKVSKDRLGEYENIELVDKSHVEKVLKEKDRVSVFNKDQRGISSSLLTSNFMIE